MMIAQTVAVSWVCDQLMKVVPGVWLRGSCRYSDIPSLHKHKELVLPSWEVVMTDAGACSGIMMTDYLNIMNKFQNFL